LRRSNRVRLTPFTKVDIDVILEEIALAQREGVAIADQETFIGDISTAAPVFDSAGQVIGAVNIAVPSSRWKVEEVRRKLSALIRTTAQAISDANRAHAGKAAQMRSPRA
jgi:DNA-binding IclR family transcriptional regulator